MQHQTVGRVLLRAPVARIDGLEERRRYGERPRLMRDDRDRFAIRRAARAVLQAAFVAEQFEFGKQRQLEVVDAGDTLADVQRND